MESQSKQETTINNFLQSYDKKICSSHNLLKSNSSIEDFKNILYHCFYYVSNSLDNIHIIEYVKQSIMDIKFLFQSSNFAFDNCDILLIIQILLTIYSKTDEIEIRHDILDLIEYVSQHNRFVSLYIINETNFVQDCIIRFSQTPTHEDQIQFIHFLSVMPLTEYEEIMQFFLENNIIEFLCFEFKEICTSMNDQDPEVLSILASLLDNIMYLYSQIQLLSDDEFHLILSTFFLVLENRNDFYFYELFIDDIISTLISSIKIINPSLLVENGLYDKLLSNLYSIDVYSNNKKLILIFFSDFLEANSSDELIEQLDFELIFQSLTSLDCSDLFPYIFNFFKIVLFKKLEFFEFFIQIEYANFFVEKLDDLSYKSQISFWSLILTIISSVSTEYSEIILTDQVLINHLFEFLRVADKDFVLSHINYLIESSKESYNFFEYYQQCLYDFILELDVEEPEIFDKFQDFITSKD